MSQKFGQEAMGLFQKLAFSVWPSWIPKPIRAICFVSSHHWIAGEAFPCGPAKEKVPQTHSFHEKPNVCPLL